MPVAAGRAPAEPRALEVQAEMAWATRHCTATTPRVAQQDRHAVAVQAGPRAWQALVAMGWVTRHCMATMPQAVRVARPKAVAALAPGRAETELERAETEWAAPMVRGRQQRVDVAPVLVAARWLGQAERAAVVTHSAASQDATRQVPVAGVRAAECPAQAAKTTR